MLLKYITRGLCSECIHGVDIASLFGRDIPETVFELEPFVILFRGALLFLAVIPWKEDAHPRVLAEHEGLVVWVVDGVGDVVDEYENHRAACEGGQLTKAHWAGVSRGRISGVWCSVEASCEDPC